jgi:hypothetical protein
MTIDFGEDARAFVVELERIEAAKDPAVPLRAREACDAALASWQHSLEAGRVFLHDPRDAEARLAAIRICLLHRLSRLASPGATSLRGLLALSPVEALRTALREATDGPSTRPRRWLPRATPYEEGYGDLGTAARALAGDRRAAAPSLNEVSGPLASVRLLLPVPGTRNVDTGTADIALCYRRPAIGRFTTEPVARTSWQEAGMVAPRFETVDAPTWRAIAALVEAMSMADRLALPEPVARQVCRSLVNLTGQLVEGSIEAPAAIGAAAALLDREPEVAGARAAAQHSIAAWPAVHAVMVRALDRFARHGEVLAPEPIRKGDMVNVRDGDNRKSFVVGRVERRLEARSAGRHTGTASEPPFVVRIDHADERVPAALVDLLPRWPLLTS